MIETEEFADNFRILGAAMVQAEKGWNAFFHAYPTLTPELFQIITNHIEGADSNPNSAFAAMLELGLGQENITSLK